MTCMAYLISGAIIHGTIMASKSEGKRLKGKTRDTKNRENLKMEIPWCYWLGWIELTSRLSPATICLSPCPRRMSFIVVGPSQLNLQIILIGGAYLSQAANPSVPPGTCVCG